MPSAGFEPVIPASELPQTFAVDRSATGIRSMDCLARSNSLYRLRCPGPSIFLYFTTLVLLLLLLLLFVVVVVVVVDFI